MLDLSEYFSTLQAPCAAVVKALAGDAGRVWVRAATGAGRHEVVRRLQENRPELAVVELPPLEDPDAPAHGLVQVAAHLSSDRGALLDGSRDLGERAADAATLLGTAGRVLVLLVPASWSLVGGRTSDAKARVHQARAFLDGLLGNGRPCVLLTGERFALEQAAGFQLVRLPPAEVNVNALRPGSLPSPYGEAVARVADRMRRAELRASPIQIRLAVGLLALGASPHDVLPRLGYAPLEPVLRTLFGDRPDLAPVCDGLVRLSRARWPLPLEVAKYLARLPVEHEPFAVHCIGYGREAVRMSEPVREAMGELPGSCILREEAHQILAAHHRTLDGVAGPASADWPSALHWLEKVHHLGHGGPTCAEEWSRQELPSRELCWDRARALSVEREDYLEAADVYRRCLERFGDDDYSCHYYAFNLDRAGRDPATVETYFRRAVELDPNNPWWNGRLVNFLIDRARFDAARREWAEAIRRVDPDGSRVHETSELALEMHRWVIRNWLRHGEAVEAREALEAIPARWRERISELRFLAQRLGDLEEAVELGESVYPASEPLERRWRERRVVPEQNADDVALERWYPGRILSANDERVTLVYADPATRQVFSTEVSAEDWRRDAMSSPRSARGYVEIGTYCDGTRRILPVEGRAILTDPDENEESLRYLTSQLAPLT